MIDIKGRNGWFRLKSYRVRKGAVGPVVEVGLFSQRRGTKAPVTLEGTKDEMLGFLRNLMDQIEKGEPAEAALPGTSSQHLVKPSVKREVSNA